MECRKTTWKLSQISTTKENTAVSFWTRKRKHFLQKTANVAKNKKYCRTCKNVVGKYSNCWRLLWRKRKAEVYSNTFKWTVWKSSIYMNYMKSSWALEENKINLISENLCFSCTVEKLHQITSLNWRDLESVPRVTTKCWVCEWTSYAASRFKRFLHIEL